MERVLKRSVGRSLLISSTRKRTWYCICCADSESGERWCNSSPEACKVSVTTLNFDFYFITSRIGDETVILLLYLHTRKLSVWSCWWWQFCMQFWHSFFATFSYLIYDEIGWMYFLDDTSVLFKFLRILITGATKIKMFYLLLIA